MKGATITATAARSAVETHIIAESSCQGQKIPEKGTFLIQYYFRVLYLLCALL